MENGISPTLTCGCSGKCIKVEQAFQSALWMTNALGQRCSRWDDALAATLRNSEWSTEQTTSRIGESYYPTFLAHNVTFESAWVTQISKDYTCSCSRELLTFSLSKKQIFLLFMFSPKRAWKIPLHTYVLPSKWQVVRLVSPIRAVGWLSVSMWSTRIHKTYIYDPFLDDLV